MTIALYVGFLLASFVLVLQIFRFSTYHAYFFKSLPFLLSYSIIVGFLVYWFDSFHPFWLTQVWASGLLFWLVWRGQARRSEDHIQLAPESPDQEALAHMSVQNTKAYYWLSVVTYLLGYVIAFLAFLNTLRVSHGLA